MTAKKYANGLFYTALLLLVILLMESERMADAARASLTLCARSLIPALLVPLVLSGILSAYGGAISLPGGRLFTKAFHLPCGGLSPFLLGALCGFPIGVKTAAELYDTGLYTEEDAMRVAALSANTGPAFAVAGVGISFFGSARVGWCLYLIQLLSAVILGVINAKKHPLPQISEEIANNTLHISFSDILYRSSLSLLTVTGTVTFFGTFCGLFSFFMPKSATAVIAAFLEVGNGAYYASRLPSAIGIPLAAFAISFSGISVLFQNAALLAPRRIPIAPIVSRKLLQGALAMLITLLLLPILQ